MKKRIEFSDDTLAASAALGARTSTNGREVGRLAFDLPVGAGAYGLREINLFGVFGLDAEFVNLTDPQTVIRAGYSGHLNAPLEDGGRMSRPIFRLYQNPSPGDRRPVFDYLPEFTRTDRKNFPALGCVKEDFPVIFNLQNPQKPLLLHGVQRIESVEKLRHYFAVCEECTSILSSFAAELNPEAFPFATEPKLRRVLMAARQSLTGEPARGMEAGSAPGLPLSNPNAKNYLKT